MVYITTPSIILSFLIYDNYLSKHGQTKVRIINASKLGNLIKHEIDGS